ncbi:MAG: redoxin domain-containing protein [Gemmataceae bacterium]|nr:redoxin domain-containing protein [Gemmataceae bacterium]
MKTRIWFTLALLAAPAAPALADPPVTSNDAPAPGPVQLRMWLEAMVQAPWAECFGPDFRRSEALRMLLAVQRNQKLGPGVGWYDPSRRTLDWQWLAARFDADADGHVVAKEQNGAADLFAVLDRDRDGAVTRDDLDWSQNSAWVRNDALSLRFLRLIDSNGNGRVTDKEWLAMFKKMAKDRDHFNAEDMRYAFMASDRNRGGDGKGKRVFKKHWLRCLVEGDLGSPFEGPRPGQVAPDFTLPTPDGQKQITLSDYRGKKPVVLIFGSFT